MLTPCSPCICPGAPCEQCMFGYQSRESNHDTMLNILINYINGNTSYSRIAEYYMSLHPDWRDDAEVDLNYIEEHITVPLILKPEDYTDSEWLTICKVFGLKLAERIVIRDYKFEAMGILVDIPEEEWTRVFGRLNNSIADYVTEGDMALVQDVLLPLRRRYDDGERTRTLYHEIIALK